eukprot:11508101-Alexandrium_andersonii.AAC.1
MGITHVCPLNTWFCASAFAGRLDARAHELARPQVKFPAQRMLAESIQRRSTSSSAVRPMQINELKMAIDELCVHCFREDVCWLLLAGPLEQLKVPELDTFLAPELPDG